MVKKYVNIKNQAERHIFFWRITTQDVFIWPCQNPKKTFEYYLAVSGMLTYDIMTGLLAMLAGAVFRCAQFPFDPSVTQHANYSPPTKAGCTWLVLKEMQGALVYLHELPYSPAERHCAFQSTRHFFVVMELLEGGCDMAGPRMCHGFHIITLFARLGGRLQRCYPEIWGASL